jgi:hypothetical protein
MLLEIEEKQIKNVRVVELGPRVKDEMINENKDL